ncbi:hypothetical protein RHODGE_RHODGE_03971 [Rhodoplanes serenus]|uniref:Uncharacterized protein n=1 Tax=Rhodoplanes serenus TaxID=200615 RepID=A0A447CZN3_9BRAD|nr:hypothetical protein [Rhodoplanes serenus]VCU10767.1 hypothetical protein RHODGE_RHODGE_03971 [Rhodoplanes serenus]
MSWQVPDYSIPIGKGPGWTGFAWASPGAAGAAFLSNGAAVAPSFTSTPTWTGLHTFSVGLASSKVSVAPPAGTTALAIDTVQYAAGAGGGPGASLNNFFILSDQVDNGPNFVSGFSFIHGWGGAAAKGGRQAFVVVGSHNGATDPSWSDAARFYVTHQPIMQVQAGDNGTLGAEKGYFYAENPYLKILYGATHLAEGSISEYNTDVRAGASLLAKYGIKIVQVATDAVSGSVDDAAFVFGNQPGAVGWNTAIQIGVYGGAPPLKSTGTVIRVRDAMTIANGIDLSAAVITGNAWASPGAAINGSGAASFAGLALSSPLVAIYGGTGLSSYALGDLLYASAANTLSRLSGNTSAAKQYLSQTGTGSASAAPVWSTIAGADITGAAMTKVDDSNVTLTLGGTPSTALLRSTSLTLGWTGQLAGSRGGTGIDNGTKTITLGGNLTTAGAYNLTLTQTGATNVTLPTSGTLAALGGANDWTGANVFFAANSSGLSILSGNASAFTYMTIGRSSGDFNLGVAAGAGQFFSTAVAGDAAIQGVTNFLIGTQTAGKKIQMFTDAGVLATTIDSNQNLEQVGSLKSSSAIAGIGYATGAGGAVTQVTSKSTGVTLNKVSGEITLNNAALAAGTTVGFTMTNSAIAAADLVAVAIKSGATANSYTVTVTAVAAGSCRIELRNTSGGSLSEAVVLSFVVIKGVTS